MEGTEPVVATNGVVELVKDRGSGREAKPVAIAAVGTEALGVGGRGEAEQE